MKQISTKKLVLSALMAALCCIATMIIKIPTPTMGYIHPGDAFVLLSGLLLGPIWGGIAAGIGSGLSDLLSGYAVYVIPTLIIKGLVAFIFAHVYRICLKLLKDNANNIVSVIVGGIAGELFMVLGYFLVEIFLLAFASGGSLTSATLAAGITASAAGISFNLVQGTFGVIICTILSPIVNKLKTSN